MNDIEKPYRPTKQDLLAAANQTVADVIAPGLKLWFVGINPGLYSAAVGHHFARPGNRFWPALYEAGYTGRLLSPGEERQLLERGYGITNLVRRATATADELTKEELRRGGQELIEKIERYPPEALAVLGVGAYRTAFERPKASLGRQPESLGGVPLWVLPNPSGLNAHYRLGELARLFRELREAVAGLPGRQGGEE
jgi:TDG/mug DNA glycosylase family protein